MFEGEATTTGTPQCANCTRRKANSRHGLCTACYEDRAVRARFKPPPPPPKVTVCRHCSVSAVCRPRGLCWRCYYTPGVKELYPTDPRARKSPVTTVGQSPPPAEPTDAVPGSEEKIAVLAARAARGEGLHHPLDVRVKSRRRSVGEGTLILNNGRRVPVRVIA